MTYKELRILRGQHIVPMPEGLVYLRTTTHSDTWGPEVATTLRLAVVAQVVSDFPGETMILGIDENGTVHEVPDPIYGEVRQVIPPGMRYETAGLANDMVGYNEIRSAMPNLLDLEAHQRDVLEGFFYQRKADQLMEDIENETDSGKGEG